jgi:hypothetical protein
MYEKLLDKRNVVGVGAGYKVKGGQEMDILAIVALVEKKLRISDLRPSDLVPKTIGGFPTDVIEVGKIVALETTGKYRPAPGGVSIGHIDITAGTLGSVVRSVGNGERLILSNNHVLANQNDAEIGDLILQPGSYDGGGIIDTIGELYDFVPIMFGNQSLDCPIANTTAVVGNAVAILLGSSKRLVVVGQKQSPYQYNLVDAALARPYDDEDVFDEILDIGVVTGTKAASLGMPVRKYGRTTDYTEDRVLTVGTTIDVGYGGGRTARFEEQIVVGPMSAGGDSGSLVVDRDSQNAVGLLFAGSDTHTILNSINFVMSELNIRF